MKYIGTKEQLENYGFEYREVDLNLSSWEPFELLECWVYEIGHSRRGQYYYLTTNINQEINVYASRPDGSGTDISLPDVLFEMMKDGVISID